MDTVLNALKDVIKFKTIDFISTGNKGLDSALMLFVMAVVGMVLTGEYWAKFASKFKIWLEYVSKRSYELTPINFEYYDKILNDDKYLNYITWRKDNLFTNALCVFFTKHLGWKSSTTNPILLNLRTLKTDDQDIDQEIITKSIDKTGLAVYVCKSGNVIGLFKHEKNVIIGYKTEDDFKEFIKRMEENLGF